MLASGSRPGSCYDHRRPRVSGTSLFHSIARGLDRFGHLLPGADDRTNTTQDALAMAAGYGREERRFAR
jgi:hypothetical protein